MPLQQPKRPLNPYHLFLGAHRNELMKQAATQAPQGENMIAWTGRKAGQLWRALTPAEKVPWEEKAVEARRVYAVEMAKFKASGGILKMKRRTRTVRIEPIVRAQAVEAIQAAEATWAAKANQTAEARAQATPTKQLKKKRRLPKDESKPKKPTAGGYGVFLNENKASIKSSLPAGLGETDVLRAAAAQWKGLPEETLNLYMAKYQKMFDEYKEAMHRYREANKDGISSPADAVRIAVERKSRRAAVLLLVPSKLSVSRRGQGGQIKRLAGFLWRLTSAPYHVGMRRSSPLLALQEWLAAFSDELTPASAREVAAWRPGRSQKTTTATTNAATLKRLSAASTDPQSAQSPQSEAKLDKRRKPSSGGAGSHLPVERLSASAHATLSLFAKKQAQFQQEQQRLHEQQLQQPQKQFQPQQNPFLQRLQLQHTQPHGSQQQQLTQSPMQPLGFSSMMSQATPLNLKNVPVKT